MLFFFLQSAFAWKFSISATAIESSEPSKPFSSSCCIKRISRTTCNRLRNNEHCYCDSIMLADNTRSPCCRQLPPICALIAPKFCQPKKVPCYLQNRIRKNVSYKWQREATNASRTYCFHLHRVRNAVIMLRTFYGSRLNFPSLILISKSEKKICGFLLQKYYSAFKVFLLSDCFHIYIYI